MFYRTNVYWIAYACGGRRPPPQTGARALPLLPSPQGGVVGVGGNQSWLTADMWFGNTSPQDFGLRLFMTMTMTMTNNLFHIT